MKRVHRSKPRLTQRSLIVGLFLTAYVFGLLSVCVADLSKAGRALASATAAPTTTSHDTSHDTSTDSEHDYSSTESSHSADTSAHGAAACAHTAHHSHGTKGEQIGAKVCCLFAVGLSVVFLIFYGWETWKATCGWEEVYVCVVECIKAIIEAFWEFENPAIIVMENGNQVHWLRYGEWLLTCPVILIHLSNLTGLKDQYSKRTMRLLVSDIGTIVMGASSAFAKGPLKVVFFILGSIYSANTFFHAAKVYIESYHAVPKGACRTLVRWMAWIFFASWMMFPLFFAAGPEGLGVMSHYGSTIAHTFADLLSKNIWGLLGHFLREKIQHHVLVHGDLRVRKKVEVAGGSMEIEQFISNENEAGENDILIKGDMHAAIQHNPQLKHLAVNLQKRGIVTKVSQHLEAGDVFQEPTVEPGRVVVVVNDASMLQYMQEQVMSVSPKLDVVGCVGGDAALGALQQSCMAGVVVDCFIVPAELLTSADPAHNIVRRLKGMGQHVIVYGWSHTSPYRQFIETSGCDAWVEGPGIGIPLNVKSMGLFLARIQQSLNKGLIGTTMMHNPAGSYIQMTANPGMMASMTMGGSPMTMGGSSMTMGGAGMMMGASPMMTMGGSGMTMGGAGGTMNMAQSSNPLFGTMMQPQSFTQQMPATMNSFSMGTFPPTMFNGTTASTMNATGDVRAAGAERSSPSTLSMNRNQFATSMSARSYTSNTDVADSDVVNHLITEISRLKSELGTA